MESFRDSRRTVNEPVAALDEQEKSDTKQNYVDPNHYIILQFDLSFFTP
jgi:hypothetical protein